MESLELRIFREVAYEKSVSKAAEKMGYVQSNITAHIRNLEEELGVVLFIRHSKGVSLTNEGMQLLTYADQIISLLDNATKQFEKYDPIVKIGATQTIAAHRLPVWLSAYKQSCPSVNFSVSADRQLNLIQEVADGKLDCAFVNTEFNHPKLTSAFLFHEKLAFIAPKHIKQNEIKYQPIIVTNIPGCPYRRLLETWIMKKVAKQPTITQYDTLEGIIKAVSLGMGISLLPMNVLPETDTLQVLSANSVGMVTIQLVISKDSANPNLNHFIEIVRTESTYDRPIIPSSLQHL